MLRAKWFRRRLTGAGVVLLLPVIAGFMLAYRSFQRAEEMNQWVEHTQEVL